MYLPQAIPSFHMYYFAIIPCLSITKLIPSEYIVITSIMGGDAMYGYGGGYGSNNFVLIVVLFILLIIVGASFMGSGY
jgi:uncharacterized protein (TIGR01732 family)